MQHSLGHAIRQLLIEELEGVMVALGRSAHIKSSGKSTPILLVRDRLALSDPVSTSGQKVYRDD
jgi:hypothetical protein